ncbi:Methyltransferase type 11 [Cellulomonas fimi ATCC 484]|uniref:Methyltransferase type 11 n=1 Tax=Cellulomonas fimi (strain ATCC 484 / DSM 20113 / JCM 1341 / CCUG 24087 / LMG 16345 / NBRC 15513 / NCIMB 8980 / NCTC 7547 / NRS-133) TaxID=590998 RepID=F4GYA4_CELFA|nr:Methyltransferase type 11 [Cellulomonas fimi ATCC 484]VEH30914.1 tellurite resistance protein TehB [Cellulomonas fimi]
MVRVRVATVEDLLDLLDGVFDARADATSRAAAAHWDEVLARPGHPLAVDAPDASLVSWYDEGVLPLPDLRTALDVGCGLGRNSRWLAHAGLAVTGADIAPGALARARELGGAGTLRYVDVDVLREPVPGGPFDLVYDSGCFHHLAPHRRISYRATLAASLAPGGYFGLCTFAAGRMGADDDDATLLRAGALGEGVGYTLQELQDVFADLELVAGGPMPRAAGNGQDVFSHDFLVAALFRRPA